MFVNCIAMWDSDMEVIHEDLFKKQNNKEKNTFTYFNYCDL